MRISRARVMLSGNAKTPTNAQLAELERWLIRKNELDLLDCQTQRHDTPEVLLNGWDVYETEIDDLTQDGA